MSGAALDDAGQLSDTLRMAVDFVSSRELSKQPGRVLKGLKKARRPQVVTQNGQPAAYLIPASPLGLEADLESIRRILFGQALSAMQQEAAASGANDLSEADIEAEVAATRTERSKRKK